MSLGSDLYYLFHLNLFLSTMQTCDRNISVWEMILKLRDWLVESIDDHWEFRTKKTRLWNKGAGPRRRCTACVFLAIGGFGFRARCNREKKKKGVLFGCWLMCGDTCRWGRETAQGVAKCYRKLPSAGSLPASASSSANDPRLNGVPDGIVFLF